MGVTTQDIFGEAEGAQPATPGSYGIAPAGHRLPEALSLGPVRLQIADLGRSIAYYEEILGLRVIDRGATTATLAALGPERPLIHLHERSGVRPAPRRGRHGLYHFAILLPDRPALGRFIQHLGEINARAGAADHLVSEAFYLQDPDNLGIEVYADRPREQWRQINRELMMASDPVDVADLVRVNGGEPWTGMPAGTRMGHLHLHVGDIAEASRFYSDALGFDRMVWEYPGALFLAAGGYHHHLGTNTWAGNGSTAPAADEAQLLEWTMHFPDRASLAATVASLAQQGHQAEPDGDDEFLVRDPWQTSLRLKLAPPRLDSGADP
ncbi:MAG: VOC family protein [Gemmatimonadales bacterium]